MMQQQQQRKRVLITRAQINRWREPQQPGGPPRLKATIGERVIAKQMDRMAAAAWH